MCHTAVMGGVAYLTRMDRSEPAGPITTGRPEHPGRCEESGHFNTASRVGNVSKL
jgi:hypothetical protein